MKISDQERKTIVEWLGEQDQPPELTLASTADPRTEELRTFCRVLTELCGEIRFTETVAAGGDLPGLLLRRGAVIYRAAPLGTELEPFLQAFSPGQGQPGGSGRFRPSALRLFVAPACPHCPGAVRSLLPLAAPGGPLTLEIIDSEAYGDLAGAEGIKSVPTLILDGLFRWTGTIRPGDLEELLAPGDRSGISAGALERLLESGNAGQLAAVMHQAGRASPSLGRLMASDAMSVRLGAMMVVEDLLKRSPELVEQLVPELWRQFPGAGESAQGDMLYIIGEAGPPTMSARINGFLDTNPHPEVAEAAREALERLVERHP